MKSLSQGEKKYIIDGIKNGIRYDGRKLNDFRPITIENDIFPHLNGSSRIKIADDTDIVCSVKVEVLEIDNNNNNNDNIIDNLIEINIEFSSNYNNFKIEDRKLIEYGNILSKELQSIYIESNIINNKQLCIIPNKFYWIIYIDILILQLDGNPIDICSLASLIALQCTKIPKIELCLDDDFTISNDLTDSIKVDMSNIPIIISISKIDNINLFDTNNDENSCSNNIISIAINKYGNCCGILKHSIGTINYNDLKIILNEANIVAKSIFSKIEEYNQSLLLHDNNKIDIPLRIGFLV